MNSSYILACQLHNLRVDGEGSRQREHIQLAKIQDLEKENEKLLWMHAEAQSEKKAVRQQALAEIAKCEEMCQEQIKLASELAEEDEAAIEAAEKSADDKVRQTLEDFRHSDIYPTTAGDDSTYCLCRFAKTYKDSNPQLIVNYEEFMSEYPQEWFANIDIHAPLSPMEEG
ncbi:hypothetical protein LIER_29807 [Lithospermum erythrorhizon]|uniref:Uncharacterized protein n=1 Tax=Lithospermum erythrorhizon TaxID=34254 RepID=A0AAV3RKI5_LITER